MKTRRPGKPTRITPSEELILASASPRRAQLLREAGYPIQTFPSPIEEPSRRPKEITIDLWPTALAFIKAYTVQRQLRNPNATIIGADTVVILHGRILGKPRDHRHARDMLQRLSSQTHEVITGLAILRGKRYRFSRAVSVCRIGRLSDRWLESYLDSGLWRNKAGAYGIQDHDDPWVQLISGEWSNVVGLPMQLLAHELTALQGK